VGVFRHPHLTRGVVRTPHGGFAVSRGLVKVPDEIGESQGWQRLDSEDHQQPSEDSAASATGPRPQKKATADPSRPLDIRLEDSLVTPVPPRR
jgi:hypothetical protein